MCEQTRFQPGRDKPVIVGIVRKIAVRATFDVMRFTDVLERAAAMFAERIKRTITKQAVERSGSRIVVTGKIPAFRVCKVFVAVFHDGTITQFHDCGSDFLRQIHRISVRLVVEVLNHFRFRCIGNKSNMPVTKRHIDSAGVLTA